jgi:hypothetical protein
MPRFFFDYESGVALVVDSQGTELSDLEDAKQEAMETLLRSAYDHMGLAGNGGAMAINVRDERGQQILRVTITLLISN